MRALFLILLFTFFCAPELVSAADLKRRRRHTSAQSLHAQKQQKKIQQKAKKSDTLPNVDNTIAKGENAPQASSTDKENIPEIVLKVDKTSPPISVGPDPRADALELVNKAMAHPEKIKASKIRAMIKQRQQLTKEMIDGIPDPSHDVKFAQTIDGVDRIGAGFDASDGTLKLPTLVWKKYANDGCGGKKTGRWCNIATVDSIFFRKQLPSAIAVTRETQAHSSINRRVYTDTKALAAHESEQMSFRSPVGVMVQDQDVTMLRDVQTHSDLMLARREQRMYTLKLYPFQSQAVDTAFIKAELLEAFLGELFTSSSKEKKESEGEEEQSGSAFIPDCVLHDCMIRDERDDMPSVGCQFMGMKLPVPSCDDLNKMLWKGKEKFRCQSKFFMTLPQQLESKNYKLTETCKDAKAAEDAKLAGPGQATCTAHGVDLGTICNAHDMSRLGRFVSRWGTHFVESASFGGEMEITVQMRKNRPSSSSSSSTTMPTVNDMNIRSATDHGRHLIRPTSTIADTLSNVQSMSILEPQDSSILAGSSGSDKITSTSTSTTEGINGALNAMYASGVELGQDVRRAQLLDNGIENIAISFVGGTSMPATESSVTRKEIQEWSDSIKSSPALLRKSLVLRPLFELMDHPSVHESVLRRSKFKEDGVTVETNVEQQKLMTLRLKKSLARKRKVLENHLRWFMVKSEALGTALDRSTAARVKSEHQLKVMSRTVQDWVDAVLHETPTKKKQIDDDNMDDMDDVLRDDTSSLRGKVSVARSDQVRATLEEEKSQEMLSYVMQYRRAASKFEKYCEKKCENENDVVQLRNVM